MARRGRRSEADNGAVRRSVRRQEQLKATVPERCAQCGKGLGWVWSLFGYAPHSYEVFEGKKVVARSRFCSALCKEIWVLGFQEQQAEQERRRLGEERTRREIAIAERQAAAREEAERQAAARAAIHALEESIRQLEEKIAVEPRDGEAYFQLGALLEEYFGKGEQRSKGALQVRQEAYDAYLKAVTVGLSQPAHRGKAYHRLADLYAHLSPRGYFSEALRSPLRRKHLEDAAREFRIHLKSNPQDVEIAEELAIVLGGLGRTKEQGEVLAQAERAKVAQALGLAAPQPQPDVGPSGKGALFEEKCLRLVEAMGFLAHTTKRTGDGGIDILATSNQPLTSGVYVIQCKNWSNPVGEPALRDLLGVVSSENANKGILVAASGFTQAAVDFAKGKRLELIDGAQLDELFRVHLPVRMNVERSDELLSAQEGEPNSGSEVA